MTNISSTINPRRRDRAPEQPAPAVLLAAPVREIEAPPRVLIRLPAIATAAPALAAKPAAAASAMLSTTPIVAAAPWYARLHSKLGAGLNAPRVKKQLPNATIVVFVIVGVIILIRNHTGKSQPVAAEPPSPVWNNNSAVPHGQVGGMTTPGSATMPNWSAPAATSPSAPASSPSAYQGPVFPGSGPMAPPPDPTPTSNYQSNVAPTNGWQGTAAPPGNSGNSPPGAQNDSVPPMPARGPAWNNPASDPGVVQGGPVGPEYRTAQANNPATNPPGRSQYDPNNPNASAPGTSQYPGMTTRPQ